LALLAEGSSGASRYRSICSFVGKNAEAFSFFADLVWLQN